MRPAVLATVHRMAGREPPRRAVVDVASIPVIDDPLPQAVRVTPSAFIPAGRGPWQIKAKAMRPGQSLVLTAPQAEVFRGACRGLGIKTKCARLADGRTQVQVVSQLESPE